MRGIRAELSHGALCPRACELPDIISAMNDSVMSTVRWAGLALYTLSFFLYGVGSQPPQAPQFGWQCAVEAFLLPLYYILGSLFTGQGPFFQQPLGWMAALVTGWINPVFFVTLAFLVRGRQEAVGSLRIALFLMILCCWVVFYAFEMYPREGFLLWVVGMGLVVSSPELSRLWRRAFTS